MPFFIQVPQAEEIPKTMIEYVESDIATDILNKSIDEHSFRLDNDFMENVYLKTKFQSLVNAWESNTMFSSSLSKIVEDENFLNLIRMGKKAIPLIIERIEEKPSTLVLALNFITKTSVQTNYRLSIKDACKKWVRLYKTNN